MNNLIEGKLTTKQLNEIIFPNTGARRSEVLLGAAIGKDCALIQTKDIIAVSTDPITATDKNAGRLAVLINTNDIASSGAIPFAILLTILLPVNSTEKDLRTIMEQVSLECKRHKIQIIGGHTEVTDSVNKPILIITALGEKTSFNFKPEVSKEELEGSNIYISKTIGIEGTMIIYEEKSSEVKKIITEEEENEIKNYIDKISILEESEIGIKNNALIMHDITEGGLLGAIFEICQGNDIGCKIYENSIPISSATKKICDYYKINPLRLISSGSLIIISKEEISNENVTKIGTIEKGNKLYLIDKNNQEKEIENIVSDELYKII